VLELDEFDSETWLNYSHLLFQYESYSEAIDLLKKAIKINPKKAELSYRISAYLFKSGNDELGLKFFKEALIINYEKHEDFFRYIPSVKSNIILLNLLTKHKK
jgi:tetratricopeptide (TPR) repeat protein